MDNQDELRIEVRKVQALTGERSLTVVLPSIYSRALGIRKGDLLTVRMQKQQLVLEKANI